MFLFAAVFCASKKQGSRSDLFQHNQEVFSSIIAYLLLFCVTCHCFHVCQHGTVYFVWLPSPFSGITVLVIGVIIPLYADSLSLNPLRSTLCHAWLTCLRWCQVLAVSRRLPYATVLLSPPMSVKLVSTWAQYTERQGTHPETQWQWEKRNKHTQSPVTHSMILYTNKLAKKVSIDTKRVFLFSMLWEDRKSYYFSFAGQVMSVKHMNEYSSQHSKAFDSAAW